MTYDQARRMVPKDAEWHCSFGYPGRGGYVEIFRAPDGKRYELSNGLYDGIQPYEWKCEVLGAVQAA